MWGIISTTFLVLYVVMSYYIGRRGWTTFGKNGSGLYPKIYWGFFVLLIFAFPAAEMMEDFLPAPGGLLLTLWGGYSMIAVLYIFFLVLFIDILRLLDKKLSFFPVPVKQHKKTPLLVGASVVILVAFTVVYGGWNARNPIVKEYHLDVEKQAGTLKQLRIAMVSDIHYGPIINDERLIGMAEIMKEIQPDIILLGGDITDGRLPQEDGRRLADFLGRMDAEYGTFAVAGNHDRDLRGDGYLTRYFEDAGVKVLKDEYVKIADSFYLIGRDDARYRGEEVRKELNDVLKEVEPSLPLILLDHQPVDLDKAQENKIDLQLSGHTHMGQIFPANFITGMIYETDWGLLEKGNYNLIVSSGYGTWGPPLRIGNSPEVVLVTMNFKYK